MYYTYIVQCNDSSLYTGYTNDLEKRVSRHNQGNGAKYTSGRRPVKLVYFEKFENKIDAMKREYVIKKLPRYNKLLLISKNPYLEIPS